MPAATQYQPYTTTLTANGGTPPYTWSVVTSTGVSLPEGMTLNTSTGVVSAAQVNGQGGYAVTLQVTDSASPSHAVATATLNFGVYSDTSLGGCQIFPVDSIYNQRVDQLPVDTTPSHQIPASYLNNPLHPDFGRGFYPFPGGIPWMRVPANQPLTHVNLPGDGQIDPAGTYSWPFPAGTAALVEGTSYGTDGNDHHTLILQSSVNNITGPQTGPCTLYETYSSSPVPSLFNAGSNTWSEGAGIHYVLDSNELAASESTLDDGAQDSAGVPVMPLLLRYSEVPAMANHPLRITFPGPTNWFVWPATGCCTGSGIPQGLLYRLKASVNWQTACPVASYPQAATLLQTLQQYGAYMSDHGSAGYMQGVPDIRWDDEDLGCIKKFHISDLEVVDNSMLEVSPTSGQTKPYVAPATLPTAAAGNSYTYTLSAVGGNPTRRHWSIASGALPPGMALNASTGTISGLIDSSATASYNFQISVTDTSSGYNSASQSFSLPVTPFVVTIQNPVEITVTSSPGGLRVTIDGTDLRDTAHVCLVTRFHPHAEYRISAGSRNT
ncbi:MAG: Ig domain-containing protein [Ignavibacteriota bacterium]